MVVETDADFEQAAATSENRIVRVMREVTVIPSSSPGVG
jgi:hypothetical protein